MICYDERNQKYFIDSRGENWVKSGAMVEQEEKQAPCKKAIEAYPRGSVLPLGQFL